MDKLKNRVANLPEASGVYIFKDSQGQIIYIGKAKSLKKRVQTYFSRQLSTKTQAMVSKIADIEHILTSSEVQAQILEASLVKEKQPQYNISLKDDKSFPWIKITDEEFPIVSIMRKKGRQKNDTALYFGPYTDGKLLRQALKTVRYIFGFRSCFKIPKKLCLYYRLNLCPAPCTGRISPKDYQRVINNIILFLEGRQDELIRRLSFKMQILAKEKRYEEAAQLRDQIQALASTAPYESSFRSLPFKETQALKRFLNLRHLPRRIEAFDVSNIFGNEACASMVAFDNGLADKDNYRRFRIKKAKKIDDYQMLQEVIRRRYQRVIGEGLRLPDLIIIDGGKGHLNVAYKELLTLNLNIPLISIAKPHDDIYVIDKDSSLKLKTGSLALHLIQRVRNEAHRFALSYHHVLRRKKTLGK
jgi:excinuclease ABC subunit C